MKGRVRLCPYYFVEQEKVKLRGALATIVAVLSELGVKSLKSAAQKTSRS